MEKKRTKFFIRTKLTFTAIFLSIIFSTYAQKLETFKSYCGGFYKSMADLLKMQQKETASMALDQDKRLQVLAANAAIGKQLMQPLLIVSSSKKSYLNGTKFLFMPQNTYRSLPLESLYELLSSSIRDMFSALDTKQDNLIAYKAIRKQVELLLEVIDEKRQGAKPTNPTNN